MRTQGPFIALLAVNDFPTSIYDCAPYVASVGDFNHTVLVIGYRYRPAAAEPHEVLIKNSWGDETSRGTSHFYWVPYNHCFMDDTWMYAVSGVHVDPGDELRDDDSDGIPDFVDQCLGYQDPTSGNSNIDGDSLGDHCDLDMDGDDVLDPFDVDPQNSMVAFDLDDDGHADQYSVFNGSSSLMEKCSQASSLLSWLWSDCCDDTTGVTCCLDECDNLAARLNVPFDLQRCRSACQYDTCSSTRTTEDPACYTSYQCTDQVVASTTPGCLSGVLYKGGVAWPYYYPPESEWDSCRGEWADPDQADADADGVGDVCDPDPLASKLDLSAEVWTTPAEYHAGTLAVLECVQDEYNVSFRAYGGTPSQPVTRTGVSVGACRCPGDQWVSGDGCDWHCPRNREDLSSDPGNKVWDQIVAEECNGYAPQDPADQLTSACRDRAMDFRPGTTPDNLYQLRWDWRTHVDWASNPPTPIDLGWDPQSPFTVKIRVDWPNGIADPTDNEKAFLADERAQKMLSGCHLVATARAWIGPLRFVVPWWGPYRPEVAGPSEPWAPYAVGVLPGPMGDPDQVVTFRQSPERIGAVADLTFAADSVPAVALTKVVAAELGPDPAHPEIAGALALVGLEEGGGGLVTEGGEASLWIARLGSESAQWIKARDLLGPGAQPPPVTLGEIVYLPARHELILVGRTEENPALFLWSLSLQGSSWQERGRLDLPEGLTGFRLAHDPVRRRTFLVGGELATSDWGSLLVLLDPVTGAVTHLSSPGLDGIGGRADAGVYLDPGSHRLYIYGGRCGGEILSDGAWVDTVSLAAASLANGGDGPGPRVRPYVQWDPRRGALWVAAGSPQATSRALVFWRLDPERGTWEERTLIDPDSLAPNSQSGTFSLQRPAWLVYQEGSGVVWPGQPRVASLTSTSTLLGLRVRDARGEILAERLESGGSTVRVAFLGLPGERYSVEVVAGPGFGPDDSAGYVLRVDPASLTEEASYSGWRANAMLVSGEAAVLAGKRGVEVVDLSDPGTPALLGRLKLSGKGQALVACGPGVTCLASAHTPRQIRTLDILAPTGPTELGYAFGLGFGRGVAYGEGLAYVAAGMFGVQVFDVTVPAVPLRVDRLDLGGLVVDVAWRSGVLYAALGSGEVVALRASSDSSPAAVGRIQTQAHAVALRLVGDTLLVGEIQGWMAWAHCLAGLSCATRDRAEAFDISANAWGTWLGSWQGEGLRWLEAAFLGDRVAFRSSHGLTVYRTEVQP